MSGQELIQHHRIGSGFLHKLTNWRFPDTATRISLDNQFVGADIDKMCYDMETFKYYMLESVNTSTGEPTWKEIPLAIANVGEANTISSVGGGVSLYSTKVGVDLRLKTITQGSGITIGIVGDLITISASAAAPAWGAITGTLSSQSDLWTVLSAKANTSAVALVGHTHSNATTSVAGYMSGADKTKLDGLITNSVHTGDVTGGTVLAIAAQAVTFAKMQNLSGPNILLGRGTAAAGSTEEITLGIGLTMTAGVLAVSNMVETTFTPVAAGTGTAGTATYTTQQGKYQRIGSTYNFQLDVVYTGHTGTGNVKITGLPIAASGRTPVTIYILGATITSSNMIQGYIANGATEITLDQISILGVATSITIPAAGTFIISGSVKI